ncbi:MAG: acyltransferase [Clostridiales bacterium]|nr:acyltransferase [Clostridiales bacterium]
MQKNSKIVVLGNFSMFYECDICIFEGGELILGSGYTNYGTQIRCSKKIVIGDNVAIANNVVIMDSDFHNIYDNEMKIVNPSKSVLINDNVWIGREAIIMKGVTIGKGSIVAARSVVTKSIPENVVVAGNPAKVIKTDISWGL